MNIVEARKRLNDIERRAALSAKKDNCMLCEQPQTSFCRSHLIPDFVLRNIAKDGYLVSASGIIDLNEIVGTDMQVVDYLQGHREACTFQIICRPCDSRVFADYEDEDSLLIGLSSKMLAEIALKNHLMKLSKRYHEIELYKILDQEFAIFEGKKILDDVLRHDIQDELFQLRRCKKIIDNDLRGGYQLIFSALLDWVAPIAVQSPIVFHKDLEGNVINEIFSDSDNVIIRSAHLIVFPLSHKTLVALFFHQDDSNYVKFQHQFSMLSYQEQLQMINYYIFKYTESYVISPHVNTSLTNNEALRKLSAEANEVGGLGIISISDFNKKYEPVKPSEIPNFLLMRL